MDAVSLEGGFSDAPRDAAHAFRAVMTAMAHPGRIVEISGGQAPGGLSVAAATVLLTLCDPDTPIHLAGEADTPATRDWIAFHTGAPMAGAADAQFAVGPWSALLPLSDYPQGTPDYPDRSATLIVELPELLEKGAVLTGPGIRDRGMLSLPDTTAFQANAAQFPLGLDFLFTCGGRLAALPRTTRVE